MSQDKTLSRIARAKKPAYLDGRSNDQLLEMVIVLAQELSVTRDRLDTLERLVADAGGVDLDALDSYQPTKEVDAQRSARRADLLARLTRRLEANLSGAGESDA